jgi:hypothetical protein
LTFFAFGSPVTFSVKPLASKGGPPQPQPQSCEVHVSGFVASVRDGGGELEDDDEEDDEDEDEDVDLEDEEEEDEEEEDEGQWSSFALRHCRRVRARL